MGGGTAEGLRRHQTWWPFWLPSCIYRELEIRLKQ